MKRLIGALCAFVLVFGAAPVAPEPVDQVLLQAESRDGQLVRLRGTIDQCTIGSCHLCAGPDSRLATCINLREWQRDQSQTADSLDTRYRFADVVVTARLNYYSQAKADAWMQAMMDFIEGGGDVNAEAWHGNRDKRPRVGDAWLSEVKVERVVLQRRATAGLLTEGADSLITPASRDRMILADFAAQAPRAYALRPGRPVRLYRSLPVDGMGLASEIWVCEARSNDVAVWPTRFGHLMDSPANAYRCFGGMLESANRWHFWFGDDE